jgi:gliding motility-associated-like protein
VDFSHIFAAPGTYQVELFVQSDAGCIDSVMQTITIYDLPVADISSSDACVGQLVSVTSNSSIAGNTPLANNWTINGVNTVGNSAILPTLTADTIDVQLISTSQNNCSDTVTETFIIYENPTADFVFVESCQNTPVNFTNSSTLLSVQNDFQWIYNGSVVASSADYSNQFTVPGQNSMTLVVEDIYPSVTCNDTIIQNFFVHALPVVSYIGDTTICEDLEFVFTNQTSVSTGEQLSYNWEINGNSIASTPNLSYTIIDEGVYPITLTATSDFGCESDSTFNMYVYPTPQEPILEATTPICPGDPITFSAQGEPNSTISWTGPGNFTSNDFIFTTEIELEQMGWYTAFITSEYGCLSDTANVFGNILYIYDFDDFEFPNVITPNNDATNDELDLQTYFKTCEEYTLYILNRWGNVVYTQTLGSTPFRGLTQGGDELEAGVYFYKLVVNDSTEDKSVKQGYIHIVR